MKPMHPPARAAIIKATMPSLTSMAITSMVRELMVATPTAKPSSPSIRFTALVMATIQITERGMAKDPRFQ